MKLGDSQAALQAFTRGAQTSPQHREAWNNVAAARTTDDENAALCTLSAEGSVLVIEQMVGVDPPCGRLQNPPRSSDPGRRKFHLRPSGGAARCGPEAQRLAAKRGGGGRTSLVPQGSARLSSQCVAVANAFLYVSCCMKKLRVVRSMSPSSALSACVVPGPEQFLFSSAGTAQ